MAVQDRIEVRLLEELVSCLCNFSQCTSNPLFDVFVFRCPWIRFFAATIAELLGSRSSVSKVRNTLSLRDTKNSLTSANWRTVLFTVTSTIDGLNFSLGEYCWSGISKDC